MKQRKDHTTGFETELSGISKLGLISKKNNGEGPEKHFEYPGKLHLFISKPLFPYSFRTMFVLLLLLIGSESVLAEVANDQVRHKELKKYALSIPDSINRDTPELVEYFEQFAKNNRELLVMFYYWITHNIDYDVDRFLNENKEYTDVYHTLETGLAMCQGYAELLCDFCKWAYIECEVINGYVKGIGYINRYLDSPNHLWNAVRIDGQWNLFDLTWASGHLRQSFMGTIYVKSFNEKYIFADPNIMILTHLPVDPKWQLLEHPLSKSEFFSRSHNRARQVYQERQR